MGINGRSLINKVSPSCIALTMTAIHHWLSGSKTGEFKGPPEFGPGGGEQRKCNTSSMNYMVSDVYADGFRSLHADFHFSSPEVEAEKVVNIHSMIHRMMHSTGTVTIMAQPHNHQGSCNEDFLHSVQVELR